MKKTLAIILTAIMVLSMVITAIPFAASADETTTVLDPKNAAGLSIGKVAEGYTTDLTGATAIGSAAEWIAAFSTGAKNYGSYYLTADIDLSATDYMPAYAEIFEGSLDGCGFTVTTKTPLFYSIGAKVNDDGTLEAGNPEYSVIKNLTILANIDVATFGTPAKNDDKDTCYSAGALAMEENPSHKKTFEYTNIRVAGSIKGSSSVNQTPIAENEAAVGGLIGGGYGGFDMSYIFIDDMTLSGACVGGLVGSASIGGNRAGVPVNVENCYVNATINQDGDGGNADGGGDRVAAGGLFAFIQWTEMTIKNVEVYGTTAR